MADLFEDEHFPANIQSIYYDGRKDPGIEWKRPGEICADPIFIDDGASKQDIAQGHLSDCWFLSAAAVLATKADLFSEIIPAGQGFGENYNGKFRFRFWRYGNWEEVEIDDRLPTQNGKLYFCYNRSTSNEFWSALLEKAYAKVHRSYQALDFGYSQDALVDLTGGIGEFIDLHGSIGVRVAETEDERTQNVTKLFKRLRRLLKKNASFLCCAINAKEDMGFEATLDNGLVTGHAYSICKVTEIPSEGNPHRVIKLRNPWGWKEWSGMWSDGASDWDNVTADVKLELGLSTENDGDFWMPFEDWISNFDILNLCHLTPDSVHGPYGESLWQTASYHGIWMPGATAGGSALNPATYWNNPQYFVRLSDPDEDDDNNECTLVVSLMQKYARAKRTTEQRDNTEEAIGFDILKYRGNEPEELDGFTAPKSTLQMKYPMFDFEYFRERSRRYALSPGTYCIIPTTYTPDTEAQYILRLAYEKSAESGEVDTPSGQIAGNSSDPDQALEDLFNEYAGADSVIDARELKRILNNGIKRAQDEEFSKETARALVKFYLGNHRGTLDRDTCITALRTVVSLQTTFDAHDADGSGNLDIKELRRALKSAGYTLSKKALSAVAQKYCGQSSQLSLDDFVLIATKVTSTSAAFDEARRQGAGTSQGDKILLSKEEILQLTL